MKKIWLLLARHVREDFHIGHYITISIFLTISIACNYHYNFENTHLDHLKGFDKFINYFILYSFAYFFSIASYSYYSRQIVFKSRTFIVKSIFILAILALDSSMPFLTDLIDLVGHPQINFWLSKVAVNGLSFATIVLPAIIFYCFLEHDKNQCYGLLQLKFDIKPYVIMLMMMLPLIIAASFHESFQRQYPMYKTSNAYSYFNLPEYIMILIYEVAYGLDFVTVEFLFRGLFVIGMAKILGRSAVLPMAVVYCFLHFGKPAGEAISSIFGGYLLGVIAYETKSIWGGIIVHMGIAWAMELVAFAQKNLSN